MAEVKQQKEKGTLLQLILFIALSTLAALAQMLIIRFLPELLLKINSEKLSEIILNGSAFEQSIAAFIGFLVGNIVAKLLSFFLNRKTTFGARKYLAFSLTMFTILSIILIVVETIIGTPLTNAIFGGEKVAKGVEITTEQANKFGYWMHYNFLTKDGAAGDGWGWCNIIAILVYSLVDLIIVFIMNKFVIMNDHIFDSKEERAKYKAEKAAAKEAKKNGKKAPVEEAPAALEETDYSEEAKEEVPAEEPAKEEEVVAAPVEEAPVEEPAKEEVKEEETPAEKEAPVEEAPVEEPAAAPVEEEEAPAEEPVKEEEVVAAPVEEAPAEEPAKEEPKAEEPAPVKEEPKAEEKKEDPKPAPAPKAAAKKPTKTKNAGKVEFDLRVDGYHFEVSAINGQLMFESQGFASADTAMTGFETFKKALETGTTSVYQDKRGLWRFVINKRYVGEGYKTRAQAEAAIESVKRDALLGTVCDVEEDPEEKAAYAAAKKNFNKGTGVDWDKALKAPAKAFGKFEITGREDRGFFFTLYANNGQLLYCSRYYASEDSCEDAITTFKKACYLNNFFIDKDKFGNWRFVLKGTGAGICYYGESYATKDAAISSSESVKKFAMSAKIVKVEDED